jgi:hypothetical protein
MDVTIVEDQGTHLLISQNDRFAIVERRNGRLYNCHDGKREGIPLEDMSAVGAILDSADWTDETAARAAFDEIIARGTQLGETML